MGLSNVRARQEPQTIWAIEGECYHRPTALTLVCCQCHRLRDRPKKSPFLRGIVSQDNVSGRSSMPTDVSASTFGAPLVCAEAGDIAGLPGAGIQPRARAVDHLETSHDSVLNNRLVISTINSLLVEQVIVGRARSHSKSCLETAHR
jgi:hypothetical protein